MRLCFLAVYTVFLAVFGKCIVTVIAAGEGLPSLKMFGGRSPVNPPSCGYSVKPCDPNATYRRLDGSCTNPYAPHWGAVGDLYLYLVQPPSYQNGLNAQKRFVGPFELPSARDVKNKFFYDGDVLSDDHNLFFMIFGQFLAHDNSMTVERESKVCCSSQGRQQLHMTDECVPISIRRSDPVLYKDSIRCMNFTRGETDYSMGCITNNYASPINTVTSLLDLSMVYGNNDVECAALRTRGGLLEMSLNNGVEFLPITRSTRRGCSVRFKTGDARANQNAPLTATQTIFAREHNRIVKILRELNSHWDDERLFQEARKILIAMYQKIVYYEWLPEFLNKPLLYRRGIIYNTTEYVEDFDPEASPAVSAEYAHAAFRKFHSAIPDNIELHNRNREVWRVIEFSKNFFCQDVLLEPNVLEGVNIGMITQPMAEIDRIQSNAVSEGFGIIPGKTYGRDLISIDCQRGRDVGLNPYITYKNLFGLGRSKYFRDFTNLIDEKSVRQLRELYQTPEMVELIVGGMLEKDVEDAYVGPTLYTIIDEQFLRFRRSDHFFFESKGSGLTLDQLNNIRNSQITAIILCHSAEGIESVQENCFGFPTDNNNIVPCSAIKDLNWALWIEK